MSNYPNWWDTSVTIFNKFQDPQTQIVRWYKSVLSNCFWKNVGNKVTVGQTVLETNNIICRIPKNELYRENYVWIQLPNDQKAEFFTLSPGDIIVKGVVQDDINEYVSGQRSSDFIERYKALQGCMEIEEVGDNSGIHLGIPHYHVRGI